MNNKPQLGQAEIAALLTRSVGDNVGELHQLSEGASSRAFACQIGDRNCVVRVGFSRRGYDKDNYAFENFASADLPVPRVFQVDNLDNNHFFCISERMSGVTLKGLSLPEAEIVVAPTFECWKALLEVDVSSTQGYGEFDSIGHASYPTWQSYLLSTTDSSPPRRLLEIDSQLETELMALVRELTAFCPNERKLIHGDLGSDNMLTDGRQITAVLDWAEAGYGDPLFDIAWARLYAPWIASFHAFADFSDTELATWPHYRERMQCYVAFRCLEGLRWNAQVGDAWVLGGMHKRARDLLLESGRG